MQPQPKRRKQTPSQILQVIEHNSPRDPKDLTALQKETDAKIGSKGRDSLQGLRGQYCVCIPSLELEFMSEQGSPPWGEPRPTVWGWSGARPMHSIKAKMKELEGESLLYSHLEALKKALDTIVLGLHWHLFQQVTTELFHVTMSAFPLETQSSTN